MQKCAVPHDYASYLKICKDMQKICKYSYAKMIFICKIVCTPDFEDGTTATVSVWQARACRRWASRHGP